MGASIRIAAPEVIVSFVANTMPQMQIKFQIRQSQVPGINETRRANKKGGMSINYNKNIMKMRNREGNENARERARVRANVQRQMR